MSPIPILDNSGEYNYSNRFGSDHPSSPELIFDGESFVLMEICPHTHIHHASFLLIFFKRIT